MLYTNWRDEFAIKGNACSYEAQYNQVLHMIFAFHKT